MSAGSVRIHETAYRPRAQFPPHAHRHSSLSLILGGEGEDLVDGVLRRFAALTVIFKPAGAIHQTRCGSAGVRSVTFELLPCFHPLPLRGAGALDGCWWLHDGLLSASMLRVFSAVCEDRSAAPSRVQEWAQALITIVRRAALRQTEDNDLIHKARGIIFRDFCRSLEVASIARELHVHPVYLARVFRSRAGGTLRSEIRRRRVEYAADRLATGLDPIVQIALDAGFADHAHLCRDFRRCTGTTPSRYRALAADRVCA